MRIEMTWKQLVRITKHIYAETGLNCASSGIFVVIFTVRVHFIWEIFGQPLYCEMLVCVTSN